MKMLLLLLMLLSLVLFYQQITLRLTNCLLLYSILISSSFICATHAQYICPVARHSASSTREQSYKKTFLIFYHQLKLKNHNNKYKQFNCCDTITFNLICYMKP